MNSIQQASVDLEETQRRIILEILNQQYTDGIITTEEDYQSQLQEMLSKVSSNEPIMQVREQSNQSNPNNFNLNFQELSIDMATIFNQINLVDNTVTKHQQLNQGVINDIKLRIHKLNDELDRLELLSLYGDNSGIILEAFRDANNFETDLRYYTSVPTGGTDPVPLASGYISTLDVNKEAIKLPLLYSESALIGPSGINLGKITITKQLGSGFIRVTNPEHNINKAIDTSFETFWSETILTEAPLEVPLDSSYFGIQYGALCEFEVNFDALMVINEISLMPFSEYPMDIVAIRFDTTDSKDTPNSIIIKPTHTDGTVYNTSTTDPVIFQFPDTLVKRVRIQLNQRHYVRTNYISNKQVADELDRWFNRNTAVDLKTDGIFNPIYTNRITVNPSWVYFAEAMKNLDIKGLDKLFNSVQVSKSLTKYQYSYGLYNIGMNRNEYVNCGYYISKPMDVPGNIKSVTLLSNEEHPLPSSYDTAITHVEYSVSPDDGLNWYNIVPMNQSTVIGELLEAAIPKGGSRRKAMLRFPVDGDIDIYCNAASTRLPSSDYNFDPTTRTITFVKYDVSKTYTVNYKPKDSHEVDFIKLHTVINKVTNLPEVYPNTVTERFLGTDRNGLINLSYYPFIDKVKLNSQSKDYDPTYLSYSYVPLKIKLITAEGKHIEQKTDPSDTGLIFITNKTDYINPNTSFLDPLTEVVDSNGVITLEYQYQVIGNTIQFNTSLPANTQIIIEYPYILKNLRTRAILRRTINNFLGLTPIVNSITVNFKSLL